jgi:hypothetical protein
MENKIEKEEERPEWKWFNGPPAIVFTHLFSEHGNSFTYEIIDKETIDFLDDVNPQNMILDGFPCFEDGQPRVVFPWKCKTTEKESQEELEAMRTKQVRGHVIFDEQFIDMFYNVAKYMKWERGSICFNMEECYLDQFLDWWKMKKQKQ